MRRLILIVSLLLPLALSADTAVAGDSDQKTDDGCKVTVDTNPFFQPQNTYELLTHTRDLWHDATLKGDDKRVREHLAEIEHILDRDIRAGKQTIKLLVQQSTVKNTVESAEGQNLLDEKVLSGLPKVDRQLILDLNGIVTTKALLAESINRTGAFSNKYRLLGDYIELLRRELDLPRLQYALDKVK